MDPHPLAAFAPVPYASVPATEQQDSSGFWVVPPRGWHLEQGPAGPRTVRITGEWPGAAREVLATLFSGPGEPYEIKAETVALEFSASPEAFRIDFTDAGVAVKGASYAALAYAAGLVHSVLTGSGGTVPLGWVQDWPTVPVRMWGGWGSGGVDGLAETLDLAYLGRFNRVLFNRWVSVHQPVPIEASRHIAEAHERGIRLVFELRRQQMEHRSLADPGLLDLYLRRYDEAIDRGFSSFGLLFDDSNSDTVDAELTFARAVVQHLSDRLGVGCFEFWYCPRYYWLPGDYDYVGGQPDPRGRHSSRPADVVAAEQESYLTKLSAALPDDAYVYLASWWSGNPVTWADDLRSRWTRFVTQPLAFWDNELANDLRGAAIVPFGPAGRPAAFATDLAAYVLNTCPPALGQAPGFIACGGWAWNPEAFEPGRALSAAVGLISPRLVPRFLPFLRAYGQWWNAAFAPRAGVEDDWSRALASVERSDWQISLDFLVAAGRAILARFDARDDDPRLTRFLNQWRVELDRIELVDAIVASRDLATRQLMMDELRILLASRLPEPEETTLSTTVAVGVDGYQVHFLEMPLDALRAERTATDALPDLEQLGHAEETDIG